MGLHDEALNEDLSMQNERMHPPKTIDASVFMRPVSELNPSPPVTIDITDTLQDALMFMQLKQMGCVLITKGVALIGILSERDLIAKVLGHKDLTSLKLGEVMTSHPETFHPDDPIAFIMKAMTVGGYRHIPIVDDQDQPVGIVSMKDIVRYLVEHFPEDVMNLPPQPLRKSATENGG